MLVAPYAGAWLSSWMVSRVSRRAAEEAQAAVLSGDLAPVRMHADRADLAVADALWVQRVLERCRAALTHIDAMLGPIDARFRQLQALVESIGIYSTAAKAEAIPLVEQVANAVARTKEQRDKTAATLGDRGAAATVAST